MWKVNIPGVNPRTVSLDNLPPAGYNLILQSVNTGNNLLPISSQSLTFVDKGFISFRFQPTALGLKVKLENISVGSEIRIRRDLICFYYLRKSPTYTFGSDLINAMQNNTVYSPLDEWSKILRIFPKNTIEELVVPFDLVKFFYNNQQIKIYAASLVETFPGFFNLQSIYFDVNAFQPSKGSKFCLEFILIEFVSPSNTIPLRKDYCFRFEVI